MSCLTILGVEMQAVKVDGQKHQHTQASGVSEARLQVRVTAGVLFSA